MNYPITPVGCYYSPTIPFKPFVSPLQRGRVMYIANIPNTVKRAYKSSLAATRAYERYHRKLAKTDKGLTMWELPA